MYFLFLMIFLITFSYFLALMSEYSTQGTWHAKYVLAVVIGKASGQQ